MILCAFDEYMQKDGVFAKYAKSPLKKEYLGKLEKSILEVNKEPRWGSFGNTVSG